jgi:hypothetical protein
LREECRQAMTGLPAGAAVGYAPYLASRPALASSSPIR